MKDQLLEIAVTMIGIPWTVWVSVSIFNQRQELALLKQFIENNVQGVR